MEQLLQVNNKNNQITAKAAGDYYVSCFSVEFDLKLFKLFEYNSCVAITNADEFVKAVKIKFKTLYPEFKISWLIEILSFNYIPNPKGQAG